MKKMTYLFLLAATLGACSPKPENKIETPPKASMGHRTKRFFQWSGKMGEKL